MISYVGIDIIIFQKILMIFFLLSVLQKIDAKDIASLKYIAAASFAIYFFHPWVLWLWQYFSINDLFSFVPGMLVFPIKTLIVFITSLVTAILFKTLFGKKSRYIIGW